MPGDGPFHYGEVCLVPADSWQQPVTVMREHKHCRPFVSQTLGIGADIPLAPNHGLEVVIRLPQIVDGRREQYHSAQPLAVRQRVQPKGRELLVARRLQHVGGSVVNVVEVPREEH